MKRRAATTKKVRPKSAQADLNVRLVEVGLRDGLQNEKSELSIGTRFELAKRLAQAGTRDLEVGAFVSPKWVPQMAGSAELMMQIRSEKFRSGKISTVSAFRRTRLSAIVPNERGLEEALAAGTERIAVFASATESFSQKNINCSIKESLTRYKAVVTKALVAGVTVRGYLSMCFGCPFEGRVSEARVVEIARRLIDLGCDEVSIGDTIGVADPKQVQRLGRSLIREIGADRLAMHFHDTRGTAIANILSSLDIGYRTFDTSIGGLGGCPFAPAATGNVATEDVAYMLQRMGFKTGLDLQALIETTRWLQPLMHKELPAKVARAGLPRILSTQ